MKIRVLPDCVANQIAAGEVVGSPASVVKEMTENAVDAGASMVTVNFRADGRELVQVIDDGEGMTPADARLAFDKHATSKITSLEDIYELQTFGFRGEALPSIAAVAEESGFASVYHFSRIFKRCTGMTPTAYRNICMY
jgi:DNA mismatch repair protein MutL